MQQGGEDRAEVIAGLKLQPYAAGLIIKHPDARVHQKRLGTQDTLGLRTANLIAWLANLEEKKPAQYRILRVHVRTANRTSHPLQAGRKPVDERRLRYDDDVADGLPGASRHRQPAAT